MIKFRVRYFTGSRGGSWIQIKQVVAIGSVTDKASAQAIGRAYDLHGMREVSEAEYERLRAAERRIGA